MKKRVVERDFTEVVSSEEATVNEQVSEANSDIVEESKKTLESTEIAKDDEVITKKERRSSGSGSVYKLTTGSGYGYCIQLTSDKLLRKKYGNKLRSLGTGKDYAEAEKKCAEALVNKDDLLKKKLTQLGHFCGDDSLSESNIPL